MMNRNFLTRSFLFLVIISLSGCSKKINSKSDPGSDLLPVPKEISFSAKSFIFDNSWMISPGQNIAVDNPAVRSLVSELEERDSLKLEIEENTAKHHHVIHLIINPGSVHDKGTLDTLPLALAEQAYNLKLKSSEITINANGQAGLFYGVQTLLQLMDQEDGKIVLPEGEINDWPDLEVRMIYWDCAHHLERMETFKHAIRQASYFKINAIALKLEGHFQYKSAHAIVEPYALNTAEYQELTNYASAHYIQLVPYLDAPGHVSFILKHPEYAGLRAYPNVNYEFSITSPGTFKLLSEMFGDLMEANQGGKYILFSTDEAYYAGKSDNEKEAALAAGGKGKLLAGFITKVADLLHEKGRTVISWIEYPLDSSDISALPSHLVNGVYNSEWTPFFKQNGMRQFIYTSAQGEEPLFPNYYLQHPEYQKGDSAKGRVDEMLETIHRATASGKSGIPGVIVAAWGDAGLHPETFWLGYTAGTSAAWNLTKINSNDLTKRFFSSFYGSKIYEMERVYELLSTQAEFWNNSWQKVPSSLRSPILGNSEGIFGMPQPATDQILAPLPEPSSEDLKPDKDWSLENKNLIEPAEVFLKENNELIDLLKQNILKAGKQKHNLEVFLSIANLCRQNIIMVLDLQEIDKLLKKSSEIASSDPASAISSLDKALDKVKSIQSLRNEVFKSLETLWYQDWYPCVPEAKGRKFLFQVDDIKDHLPGRTTDLSYLIYREIHYPLGSWAEKIRIIRNQFAEKHGLTIRTEKIDWDLKE